MTDITEAVRRLRGLREDVERLKAARDEEGEVRLLRLLSDRLNISDVVHARENDAEAIDTATGGDTTHARENDAAATDLANAGDVASVATDEVGGWTWDQSHYDFDEWD